MVHPLVPLAIRGAIWYQGESNLNDGMLYTEKMKALIPGWRTVWNEGDFPFYYVQLAPFTYGTKNPTALPKMWEAQTAALAIPDTGMAVTIDIGNRRTSIPRTSRTSASGWRCGRWRRIMARKSSIRVRSTNR